MNDLPLRLSAALADRYRIERELGAGGMATVYLAHDLKHDRLVAVKVLKPELAAVLGADRFVVEIKTTASMSHPHILPLFDSGEADGFLYYVMPYIQGETIREKLNRETQCGVDEAVRITREVADALDYAHRHGVIHRDIKPENILLHDGRAMVMDFGIALAVSAAAGGRMTETGLSLGTPHYMSPEQATAEKEITGRADIYSLASVLYEMLTGNPPHVGASAQQIIMKIITEPAEPVTKFRKSVPTNVAAALAQALEKLPADRFESAKTFADALSNAAFVSGGVRSARNAPDVQAERYRWLAIGSVAALALALASLAWSLRRAPHSADDDAVIRLTIALPRGERFFPSYAQNIGVTPQGDRVAYVTQDGPDTRTMIRRTSELEAREVVSTLSNNIAFSPNGRWLAYTDGNQVKKVSVDGGASIPVTTTTSISVRGLAWLSPDTILAGSLAGLFSVPAAGGTLRPVPGFPADSFCFGPVLLTNGESIACSAGSGGGAPRRLRILSRESGKATVLDLQAAAPLGMQDGHLIYVTTAGALMAIAFDVVRQRLTGEASEIESGVLMSSNSIPLASLSPNGTLAYLVGASARRLVLSTPGRPDVSLMDQPRVYRNPRFSPDGRKVAVTVSSSAGTDIWVFDRGGHTWTRLTFTEGSQTPEWSPDGMKILYRVNATREIWWQAADGSTKPEILYKADEPVNEAVLSPDGKWLIYRTSPFALHVRDIFAVPLTGDRKPVLLVGGEFQESHPRISPDGRWMVYQSNESSRFEIYVRSFPGAGSRTQVSSEGGSEPLWSRSGRELYYRTPEGLVTASVTTGATFTIGGRRTTSIGESFDETTHTGYDVAPDGQLLLLRPTSESVTGVFVHNWGRVLREKLDLVKK